MPLTEEQKIKKKIADKKYYEKNKAKILEQCKLYASINKEKIKEYQSEYRIDYEQINKEKIKERKKQYRLDNHQKITKKDWKKYGIIATDYDLIYRVYMATDKCEFCLEPFKDSRDRHLDHNHSILDSYNIRGILCRQCNLNDKLAGYPIKIYTEICE